MHHSLTALIDQLRPLGGRLLLRAGSAAALIPALAAETGAAAVYCNRHEEPWARRQQQQIEGLLRRQGCALVAGNAALLFEPAEIVNQAGLPFRVFTPFWRACRARPAPALPLDAPAALLSPADLPPSDRLDDWRLLPRQPDWAGGLRDRWRPGEGAAQQTLQRFINRSLDSYASQRDRPDLPATSALSPHLRFGEIGPRQIWHAVHALGAPSRDTEKFLAELGWREFSYHLLAQHADLPDRPLRREFAVFPWRDDAALLQHWQRGQTGFPIVDAGMRQLWSSGWMHNRVRMVVASFLVKNLLIPWQSGAAWFWDTLVDADLASNSASWQWVAGCGADAAPFFRIFNPVLQGAKFDPGGAYVRHWCPELAGLPNDWLHHPWEAPPDVLGCAGITLGETYPRPMVDLAASRDRALAAFKTLSVA